MIKCINFSKLLIFFNIFFIVFFYYIYNVLSPQIFIAVILFFSLTNINSFFKISRYLLNIISKKKKFMNFNFILFFIVTTLLILDICSNIITFNLGENFTEKDFFFKSSKLQILNALYKQIIIIFAIYLIFFIKVNISYKKFINKTIKFCFLFSIILYSVALIDLIFDFSNKNLLFGRPLIFISFFKDYYSSKLQHAFIFLLLFIHYIFDYTKKKNSFWINIILGYAIFLIFLINSKLFYFIFFISFFLVLFLNFNKENLIKTLQICLLTILFLNLSSILINKKNTFQKSEYNFNLYNNFTVKFYHEITMIEKAYNLVKKELPDKIQSYLNSNNIYDHNSVLIYQKKERNLKTIQESVYFVNSTEERMIIRKICHSKNKFFNDRFSELKMNNISKLKNFKGTSLLMNCEGTIHQYIYKYGLFILVFFAIGFISLFVHSILYRKKYLFTMSISFLILCNYHHVLFNPVFCLIIISSYCLEDDMVA